MTSYMLRRNDIVVELDPKGAPWSPYGRVNRRIDATHVEVIDCCKHCTVYADVDLKKVIDYTGYDRVKKRYDPVTDEDIILAVYTLRMPSLRKLKQLASRYNKRVWRKYRENASDLIDPRTVDSE